SKILTALFDNSHDALMQISNGDIPKGIFSTEFADLVTAFSALPFDEMQKHFSEYKNHIFSLDKDKTTELEKICIIRMQISKQTVTFYLCNKQTPLLFAQLPQDITNIIIANM